MSDEQGTGKHKHKSAAEPYEHHGPDGGSKEEPKSSKTETEKPAAKSEGAKSEGGSDEQGTGKHPHKKASDPKEHHEGAKK